MHFCDFSHFYGDRRFFTFCENRDILDFRVDRSTGVFFLEIGPTSHFLEGKSGLVRQSLFHFLSSGNNDCWTSRKFRLGSRTWIPEAVVVSWNFPDSWRIFSPEMERRKGYREMTCLRKNGFWTIFWGASFLRGLGLVPVPRRHFSPFGRKSGSKENFLKRGIFILKRWGEISPTGPSRVIFQNDSFWSFLVIFEDFWDNLAGSRCFISKTWRFWTNPDPCLKMSFKNNQKWSKVNHFWGF